VVVAGGFYRRRDAEREIPDCQDSLPFTGRAEYFDRPRTPFTFSDPTVRHDSAPSILGFVASETGEYVAGVSVTAGRLTIHNPDLEIGDNAQNLRGTWQVQYDAPYGDPSPTVTATLPLGRFGAGLHDLPYRFDAVVAPPAHFSLTIRLAQIEQPAPAAPPAPAQEARRTRLSHRPASPSRARSRAGPRPVSPPRGRRTSCAARCVRAYAGGRSRASPASARRAAARAASSPPVAGASASRVAAR
jgi:hypothetical protein